MDIHSLHSPVVRRMLEALNNGRTDDFMAQFTHDATVTDGPNYHGTQAIRAWAERENFAVHMHIEVLHETNEQGTELEIQANSQGGYSGPGTLSFTLDGEHIKHLVIG